MYEIMVHPITTTTVGMALSDSLPTRTDNRRILTVSLERFEIDHHTIRVLRSELIFVFFSYLIIVICRFDGRLRYIVQNGSYRVFEGAKETHFSFLTLDDYFFPSNILQLLRLFVTPFFLVWGGL